MIKFAQRPTRQAKFERRVASAICKGWAEADEGCRAPVEYEGPCGSIAQLKDFSNKDKMEFEVDCQARAKHTLQNQRRQVQFFVEVCFCRRALPRMEKNMLNRRGNASAFSGSHGIAKTKNRPLK